MSKFLIVPLSALLLAGCSTMPTGPSVLVLPGTGKDFNQFNADEEQCRQLAMGQITSHGKPPSSLEEGQQAYDIKYIQCMYGRGHRVPVPAEMDYRLRLDWQPPPPPNLPPPPAAGTGSKK